MVFGPGFGYSGVSGLEWVVVRLLFRVGSERGCCSCSCMWVENGAGVGMRGEGGIWVEQAESRRGKADRGWLMLFGMMEIIEGVQGFFKI